jgi:lipid-A-disaccharide synthase
MKYYIIAGEASGDLHGSNLMKGLKQADPDSDFRFWGGDLMSSVSGTLVRHYKDTAVMGFVEVLGKLGKISSNLNFCKKDIIRYSPDVLILIDYPGFNLKIAKYAKKRGIKVFYYISPKVWAWKENRIKYLKRDIDKLFIIFPFEIEYFKKHNIDTIYEGNPLMDSIAQNKCMKERRDEFLDRHSLLDKKIIAILAGSRKSEIDWLLPRFVSAINQIKGDYQYILAAAPSIDLSYYDKYISGTNIKPIISDTYSILKQADAAIIASGTASLEAAIIGTPQMVCYGGNPVSYCIAKHFVKVKYVSLGNLIIDRLAFKEFLQNECNTENIVSEMNKLLNDTEYVSKIKESYSEIRKSLSGEGASLRVAQAMIKELSNESL